MKRFKEEWIEGILNNSEYDVEAAIADVVVAFDDYIAATESNWDESDESYTGGLSFPEMIQDAKQELLNFISSSIDMQLDGQYDNEEESKPGYHRNSKGEWAEDGFDPEDFGD